LDPVMMHDFYRVRSVVFFLWGDFEGNIPTYEGGK
jgi:hypothetical protein